MAFHLDVLVILMYRSGSRKSDKSNLGVRFALHVQSLEYTVCSIKILAAEG